MTLQAVRARLDFIEALSASVEITDSQMNLCESVENSNFGAAAGEDTRNEPPEEVSPLPRRNPGRAEHGPSWS